ncbi:Retrovirus-related Pol polyprotein from transposon TNT 1-94 [Nymphaea thermarum]|nr:Retrovirus-related Pol polyprotein from transposon TNT 1-94 [Nymphaea thermarum]
MHILISQKLNHSNYLTWKRQIVLFIKSHRLYGHIDGSTPAPPQYIDCEVKRIVVADQGSGASTGSEIRFEYETVTENNPAYEVWLAHDQSLVAYITSTLSEEVLGGVDDDLTALELWSTLATTYSQVSEARFLQLRRQFQDIKRGTRTVLEYLNEIKSVSDQLAAIGHPVSDKDKMQQALSGLGTKFDIFCTALEVLPILPSFEDLKAKLFQHEASRVQRQNLIPSNSHNVLITGTHAMQGHRTRPWTPQAGMGRGILPTPPGTNTTSSTPRRVPTCFYCNKRGHVKSECWHNPQNKNNHIRREGKAAAGAASQGAEMRPKQTEQAANEPETIVDTSLDSTASLENMSSSPQQDDPPRDNRFSGLVYSRRTVPTIAPRQSQLKIMVHRTSYRSLGYGFKKFAKEMDAESALENMQRQVGVGSCPRQPSEEERSQCRTRGRMSAM